MPNVWRVLYKDKWGGEQQIRLRGADTEAQAIRSANITIGSMRHCAIISGAEDPLLTLVSCEPIGNDDSEPGHFQPVDAKPIDRYRYCRRDENGEPILTQETQFV